ncbi:MAG TPA: thioesterase family protein [Nocardioidaceae bacterium]|nr:thioesterase family protein [Nocardioidaceae bacterium]
MTQTAAVNRTEPTLAQIEQVPPSLDRLIPHDFIDFNGHLNVRFYMEMQLEGTWRRLQKLGMDASYPEKEGRSTFAREHHIRYHAECLLGHRVTVHPVFVSRTDRNLHLVSYLVNQTTRQLSNVIEIVTTHVDLRTRRSVGWGHWAGRIDEQIAALAWEPPVMLQAGPSFRLSRD